MRKDLITCVDLGSTKVACICALEDSNGFNVVALSIVDCKGLRRGVVADLEHTANSIDMAVRKVQQAVGQDIPSLVVSIGGSHIEGINTQDVAIQEGMGKIVDRSKEHLGSTDRAIVTMRRLLLEAIKTVEAGGMPRGADSGSYRHARAVDRIVDDVALVNDTMERESVARF